VKEKQFLVRRKRYDRMNEGFKPDGSSDANYIWETNKPKKCEDCDKKTDDLYCTPIGCCNWRCRECQINLVESVGFEDCYDNQHHLYSYPIIPDGYKSDYEPKKESLVSRIINWRKFSD